MNNTTTDEILFKIPDTTTTLHILSLILLYGIGLFIQIKTIVVCKTEKNKTWQIHISHSVVMIIVFAVRIFFLALSHSSPNIFSDNERWILYIFTFENIYGRHSIPSHSLIIAIMKYVFVVHATKARVFGEDKAKKIFLFINFAFPMILAICFTVSRDFSCIGHFTLLFKSKRNEDKEYRFCFLNNMTGKIKESKTFISYTQVFMGVFHVFVFGFTLTNLLEAFFYFKIFQSMKR